MNLNQLKYFVAVAETLSFTKAAEQYYISQTAITQQIKSLEDTLGCRLLDRSTRPITITPAGSVFLKEANLIISRMEHAVTRTQNASSGLTGNLNIGYTKGYERSFLADQLKGFHTLYPNTTLRCYRLPTDLLAAGLTTDLYDVIFTWDSTNLQQDDTIRSMDMEKAPLVVAMPASHPLANRNTLKRQDLRSEPILYMSPSEAPNSFGDMLFMELYAKAGYHPNIVFRSADMESILLMVAADQGISIMPEYYTTSYNENPDLRFIPLSGEGEYEQIVALWKSDNENPALSQFLSYISE